MSEVLFEKEGGVALVTLNRPERLNAISGPMLAQLSETLIACDRDRDVRAIVLTGAGRGFCAGLDLQDAAAGTGIGGGRRRPAALARAAQRAADRAARDRQADHLRAQRRAPRATAWTSRSAATCASRARAGRSRPSPPGAACCPRAAAPGCSPG